MLRSSIPLRAEHLVVNFSGTSHWTRGRKFDFLLAKSTVCHFDRGLFKHTLVLTSSAICDHSGAGRQSWYLLTFQLQCSPPTWRHGHAETIVPVYVEFVGVRPTLGIALLQTRWWMNAVDAQHRTSSKCSAACGECSWEATCEPPLRVGGLCMNMS